MKLIVLILVTLLLIYWPYVLFTTVMLFDAPGSSENQKNVLTALGIAFYPALIGLLFYYFDATFWGLPPRYFLAITIIVPLLGSMMIGYPKLLFNNARGVSSDGYFVKDGVVYSQGSRIQADAATFTVFGIENRQLPYAADSKQVFFRGKTITGADPKSIHPVDEDSGNYFADNHAVYFEGKVVENADASSFTRLKGAEGGSTMYFKDHSSVYLLGKKLGGLNGSSARVIGRSYVTDGQSVYHYQNKVDGADPKTFQELLDMDGFAKDSKAVYFSDKRFTVSDPSSFEMIGSYGKDSQSVYYYKDGSLRVIEGADAKTFKFIKMDFAKDSKSLYFRGDEVKLSGVDTASFTILMRGYGKDKSRVYFFPFLTQDSPFVVENASPQTFEVLLDQDNSRDATDGEKRFLKGKLTQ